MGRGVAKTALVIESVDAFANLSEPMLSIFLAAGVVFAAVAHAVAVMALAGEHLTRRSGQPVALDVDAAPVTGRWFKHAYPGSESLPRRDPPPDGRWQRGDVVDALYLADEEDTAWAEWYRHLAELGVPPGRQMPRDLWTWKVNVVLANLSSDTQLDRVGLPTPRPGRRGWRPFQQVGEALAAEGWPGLVTRSAARPSHRIVCLFRKSLVRGGDQFVQGARPLPAPRTISEVPAPPRGMTT